jgi:hypothetical protein
MLGTFREAVSQALAVRMAIPIGGFLSGGREYGPRNELHGDAQSCCAQNHKNYSRHQRLDGPPLRRIGVFNLPGEASRSWGCRRPGSGYAVSWTTAEGWWPCLPQVLYSVAPKERGPALLGQMGVRLSTRSVYPPPGCAAGN